MKIETCPTCSSSVTIEGGPTTLFYVPALGHDKSLVKALLRIKELEAQVKYWEDKESKRASCCVENERGIEIAVKCLEFYADNLRPQTAIEVYAGVAPVHYDGGKRAREALKAITNA